MHTEAKINYRQRWLWSLGLSIFVLVLGFALLPNKASAVANNQEVEFQGRLLNSQGATVPDGYYNIEFKIYENGDGKSSGDTTGSPAGTLLWTEDDLNANSQGVQVVNGYLSVELGSVNPFGSSVDFSQSTLWLSMNVGSTSTTCTTFSTCSPDGEMTPMQPLNAAPSSMNSQELGGLSATKFGQLAANQTWSGANIFQPTTNSTNAFELQNNTGTANLLDADTTNNRIGIGTLAPGYTLDVQGGNGVNSALGYSVAGTQVLTSGKVLQNVTTSGTIINTGLVGATYGGTGVNSSTATNGMLLIGNGSGFGLATLTNPSGSNLAITNGAASISLGVVASPSFGSETVSGSSGLSLGTSGMTTGGIVFYGGNANSGSIDLTGPAGPASGSYTLSIPSITTNASLCTTASVCSGYQATVTQAYVNLQSTTPGTAQSGSFNVTGNATVGSLAVGTGGISSSGNISQSGANSLSTGSGNIALNGNTSVTGVNTFSVNSGLTNLGGALNVTGTATVSANVTVAGEIGIGTTSPQQAVNLSSNDSLAINLSVPASVAAALTTNASSNVAGTYYYVVTAVDSLGNQTSKSIEVSATTTSSDPSVSISWNPVVGAAQYYVYRGTTSGGENVFFGTTATSFLDTGASSGSSGTPPVVTTAYVTKVTGPGNSYFLGGNIGIGSSSPGALFSVGPSSQFEVNASGDIIAGTWQGNIISSAEGGTGLNTGTAANGSLLIGNGTGLSLATLTNPSSSNLNITNGLGSISLSVVPAPSFVSASLTGNIGLTLGTSGSTTGGIIFYGGNANSGSLTVTAPAGPASGNFTLSIPSISANANLCTDNSVCSGYAAISSDVNYVDIQSAVPGTAQAGDFNIAGTATVGTLAAGSGGITTSGNFTQSGATTFSSGSGSLSLNGITSITGSNNLTVGSGATPGGATINGVLTANNGLSVKGSSLFQTTTSTTGFQIQNASGYSVLTVDTQNGILKVWDSSTTSPINYASVSYANNTAVFSASSGVTQLGQTSGNVSIPLTGPLDQFTFSKTLTATANYSINDFSVQRIVTGSSYSLSGAVLDVEDRSSGSADSSTLLNLNQNNANATGNLLQAQNTGSNVLTISDTGVIDTVAGYQINGSSGIGASCASGQTIVSLAVSGGIATGGSCGTLLTENLANNIVQIGSTSGTQQIDLALDQYSTFADNGYCNTAGNPNGSLYYNSASSSIRSCIGGNWTDLTNSTDFMLFGVETNSGNNPGDLPSLITPGVSGPCRVSWASVTSISIAPCSAYSSGRKITVPQTTLTITGMTTTNIWEHVCLTGSNDQPVLSVASSTEIGNLPSFSPTAPTLCLADIQGSTTTANNIAQIFDVRTFSNTQKDFVDISGTAAGLGQLVVSSGSGASQSPATAAATNVLGVVAATDGSVSSTSPNAIVSVQGPVYVKAVTGTAGDFVQTSASATGYSAASSTTPSFGNLGISRTSFSSTCNAASNCLGSLYLNETIAY